MSEVAAEDVRVGAVLRLGGRPWQVTGVEWLHRHWGYPLRLLIRPPGGGGETTFEVGRGQPLEAVPLEWRPLVFLFRGDAGCVFLDPSGEQHELAGWACGGWPGEPEAGAAVSGGFLGGRLVAVGLGSPDAEPPAAPDVGH